MALQSGPSRHKKYEEDFCSSEIMHENFNISDYSEHTSPIFKFLKVLKLQDIIKFSNLKPIYFYFNDRLITIVSLKKKFCKKRIC